MRYIPKLIRSADSVRYVRVSLSAILILCTAFILSHELLAQANYESIKSNLSQLADDKMEGREPGTAGGKAAAELIKSEFRKYGLKYFGDDYFQNFKYPASVKVAPSSSMSISSLLERPGLPKEEWKKVNKVFPINTDWQVMPFSADADLKELQVAFVGFGVSASDLQYDDYAGIDVKGKAVIVLADSTLNGNSKYNFLNEYSSVRYKIMNAREHGAAAVLLVKRQSDSANVFYPAEFERFASQTGIAVVQVSRTAIGKYFPKNKFIIDLEKDINKTKKPASILLDNITINLKVEQITEYIEIPNVVAYVPGTDTKLSNEYLVVGAHFDHLGWGRSNSTYRGKPMVHNGADDNASGTAAMMELASIYSKNPAPRPIIFIAFNAEEFGLIGSAHFVKNSPVDTKQIISMINFDMVGRMANRNLSILGTGTSNLYANIIDSIAKIDSLTITKMQEGFSPSDQSSFFAADIPVLMMFSGLHSDYHTPNDDINKINFEGVRDIVNYTEKIIRTIANSPVRPDFNPNTGKDMGKEMNPKGMGGSGVWFGIVPNFAENPDGMLISGASEGSPAKEIGLQNGDVITEFAGKKMKNLYDLTYTLRELKPGDKVTVKYLRNGKPMQAEVTLRRK